MNSDSTLVIGLASVVLGCALFILSVWAYRRRLSPQVDGRRRVNAERHRPWLTLLIGGGAIGTGLFVLLAEPGATALALWIAGYVAIVALAVALMTSWLNSQAK